MFNNQDHPRDLHSRLSYANVIASLALFVALGGTAAAAVTLASDSVGSPQIRQDAVRSSEIRADEVRSPEIASGAVRSSEIRDEGVKATDISAEARTALLGELRVAEDDNTDFGLLPECDTGVLTLCSNHLVLALSSDAGSRTVEGEPARNWLVKAKLGVDVDEGPSFLGLRCGLVNTLAPAPSALLDEAEVLQRLENVALSAVVKKQAGNPTIALRCNSPAGDQVAPVFAKMTAMEVGTVTGP